MQIYGKNSALKIFEVRLNIWCHACVALIQMQVFYLHILYM